MDNQSILLNDKWRNYFNWTVLYPTLFFAFGFIAIILLVISSVIGFSDPSHSNLSSWTVAFMGTFFIGFILFIISMFIYVIWFIIASDTLFTLLGVNRVTGNILNLVGIFFFGGISFLVLPIYFWIKMRDYWLDKGQKYSWRAVALYK